MARTLPGAGHTHIWEDAMKVCSIEGCTKNIKGRGYCNAHYLRFMRTGDPLGSQRASRSERFWSKVRKTETCWEWTAGFSSVGYGAFWDGETMNKAHRLAYELSVGPIGAGKFIDHMCHNRRCVNPEHLRQVTPKQNIENHKGAANVQSKSGIRGVVWVKDCNKWGIYVSHNGKSRYYGVYESIADAEEVAIKTRNELFTHNDLDRRAA